LTGGRSLYQWCEAEPSRATLVKLDAIAAQLIAEGGQADTLAIVHRTVDLMRQIIADRDNEAELLAELLAELTGEGGGAELRERVRVELLAGQFDGPACRELLAAREVCDACGDDETEWPCVVCHRGHGNAPRAGAL